MNKLLDNKSLCKNFYTHIILYIYLFIDFDINFNRNYFFQNLLKKYCYFIIVQIIWNTNYLYACCLSIIFVDVHGFFFDNYALEDCFRQVGFD